MKTQLIICPYSTRGGQATTYIVLWPHHGHYSILWSMWCSSLRWALQDAAQDFTPFLEEMFPEGVEIHYKQFKAKYEVAALTRTMNLEQKYDLRRMRQVRAKYGLPPWKPGDDKYRYIDYEIS